MIRKRTILRWPWSLGFFPSSTYMADQGPSLNFVWLIILKLWSGQENYIFSNCDLDLWPGKPHTEFELDVILKLWCRHIYLHFTQQNKQRRRFQHDNADITVKRGHKSFWRKGFWVNCFSLEIPCSDWSKSSEKTLLLFTKKPWYFTDKNVLNCDNRGLVK